MAPGDLRRDELIELVEAITRGADTEEEDDRLVQLFEDSVVHPTAGRWVRLAERASAPTGAQDDRTTDSGAIGFPCAKTTAGPGSRCGSGQATQRLGRQGHPGRSCGAWVHHRGEVRMPQCFCPEELGGAGYFESLGYSDWNPTHEELLSNVVDEVA